jgi:AsmA protein
MKKLLIGMAAIVVVLVVAVFAVPAMIDWKSYEPDIAKAVHDATGRDLHIDGDISVSVLPLSVSIGEFRLSNAPGMPSPDMISVAGVEVKLALFPLIGNAVVVESLVIREPAIFLEVDETGRPNWIMEPAVPPTPTPADAEEGLPISGLELADVRIADGLFSFMDATTGQSVQARDINVEVALASLASALTVAGSTTLNDEAVTLDVTIDSPQALLGGNRASIDFTLATRHASMTYGGGAQQTPVPGLDGRFDIDVPSVGALADWLGAPLDESQPDPGPLQVHAELTADGANATLESATIKGEVLDVEASGSVDGSGDITKIRLDVRTGVLDIDRYLPPPSDTPRQHGDMSGGHGKMHDAVAAIPDAPFDLSGLRQTEADINIAIGGVKAKGLEIGPIGLTTTLKSGVLKAELRELWLYGGNVTGTVTADATNDRLSLSKIVTIAGIDVGALATAATGETPIAGILSATMEAHGSGASPRALVENLAGDMIIDLGGVDAAVPITEIKLAVSLPGLESPPSVTGSVVYNGQRVKIDVTHDPLATVLAGETFDLSAAIVSRHINLAYDGAVQQQPVPGLDGTFDLDVPSVGALAAWLGQPLDPSQPDPGPLSVHASLAADGATVLLKQATILGNALDAVASGSFDGSGDIPKMALEVRTGMLDIDRYLPPPSDEPADAQTSKASGDPLAAIPDTPFDLSGLRQAEADVTVAIGGVRAMGYEIGRLFLKTTLKGGVLDVDLSQLALYGGNVTGAVNLDGASDVLGVAMALNVDSVDLGNLARAAMGDGAPVAGILSSTVEATGRGASPRALVESLAGKLGAQLGGIDVKDAEVPLTAVNLAIDLPGIENPPSVSGAVVYNQERVELDISLDPLGTVLAGETFSLNARITSAPVTFAYNGAVQQQPLPGLDGVLDLDIPSVGALAVWLGQPLDESQPDPGPLTVHAALAADGPKVALNEAVIEGKALKVNATGSFDGSGAVAQFAADVVVELADLNAYLPPEPESEETAEAAPAEDKAKGWSEEPIDFSALRQANGEAKITIGKVLYKDLTVENGIISLTMLNGVVNAAIEHLAMAGGTVDSQVTIDASGRQAALAYKAAIANMAALPLLQTFAGTDRLSGTANFDAQGQATGASERQLVETLNGTGGFAFLDGAIHGVNIAETIRSLGEMGFGEDGPPQKTDFAEISGTVTIVNGLLENRDFQMLAPLLRVSGAGLVPLPPQTVDYEAELKLVASTAGQGGDAALAGLPIPVTITGSWSAPSYGVDWGAVLGAAALDPARLAAMPDNMLDAAAGFGVDLPLPDLGGGGLGGILDSVTGGGSEESSEGGLGGLLDAVTGGDSKETTTEEPAEKSVNPLEEAGDALNSLFGN